MERQRTFIAGASGSCWNEETRGRKVAQWGGGAVKQGSPGGGRAGHVTGQPAPTEGTRIFLGRSGESLLGSGSLVSIYKMTLWTGVEPKGLGTVQVGQWAWMDVHSVHGVAVRIRGQPGQLSRRVVWSRSGGDGDYSWVRTLYPSPTLPLWWDFSANVQVPD